MEFLCLLPLTIPPLVIVVGIANVYAWVSYFLGDSSLTLTFAYVVLVLPYAYRAIDAALSAIDVNTLAEAARSLGAGWTTVIVRSCCRTSGRACMSAAFVTVALVLGEFTFASLLNFPDTLPYVIAADRARATHRPRWPRRSLARSSSPPCCCCCSFVRPSQPFREGGLTMTVADRTSTSSTGVGVSLVDLRRTYGSLQRPRRAEPRDRARRDGRAARTLRLRQDDGAADPGRLDHADDGRGAGRRRGHHAGSRPTSATWAWCSRPTACSRT